MACKRKFFGDFETHSNGFLISYQNLVRTCMLTAEEYEVMGRAYELIFQMTHVGSSQWHQDEYWFGLAQTITQRLGSAASRALNLAKTTSAWDRSIWIPKSHHLLGAENVAYRLCTLFNRLPIILRNEMDGCGFNWDETVAAVGFSLNVLAQIIFSQSPMLIPQQNSSYQLILSDGVTVLSGDKFTRQLLALYYIFLLQYRIMLQEWSDSMWFEIIETSLAICRLYPSPHESQYPTSEICFMVNRGCCVAIILVADSHNCRGKSPFHILS